MSGTQLCLSYYCFNTSVIIHVIIVLLMCIEISQLFRKRIPWFWQFLWEPHKLYLLKSTVREEIIIHRWAYVLENSKTKFLNYILGCVRNWAFVQRWCLDAEFSRLSYIAINGSVNENPYSSQKSHSSVYVKDTTMTQTKGHAKKNVCTW